jgi:hypothetical protein
MVPLSKVSRYTLLLTMLATWTLVAHADSPNPSLPVTSRFIDLEPGLTLKTLEQNWTDAEARTFHNMPQGSQLLPYKWFLHLAQPDNSHLFRLADHIRKLGYLPRIADDEGNPDGLPVGFTKDIAYANGEASLGLTCAACHTNQLNFNGQRS